MQEIRMRTIELLTADVVFNEKQPHAQSLHTNQEARALRFAFLPEQSIRAHKASHSPIHLIILKGKGVFAGKDGLERECGPGMMVVFDAGETHTVRALEEELVFVSIYNGVPTTYESEHRRMLQEEDMMNHPHD
jgi:quercetin dioxygenase-like cupin family protein